MTLQEICQRLALEVQAAAGKLDAEVTGGYASDLLSYVMAGAKAGNVWVTVQGHPNIVAVASLINLAGVIVAGGSTLDPTTVERAEREGIPILTTDHTTYTVVGQLYEFGVRGTS
jgi:BioD-like phosphotransacetylase family protein